MTARFQRNEQLRPLSSLARRGNRVHFRMPLTTALMKALGDESEVAVNNNGANRRIGFDVASPLTCDLQRTPHHVFIISENVV